jgi:hypothetical protein
LSSGHYFKGNEMQKPTNPWADEPTQPVATKATKSKETTKPVKKVEVEPLYDIEGLMTDFPTAKELEKFVFDQTGHVLNLKGRSNKFKYQTAMDVLNGETPDPVLMGTENPYLDKNDMIPVEPMKKLPARPKEVVGHLQVSMYISKDFPHPDGDMAALNQKCEVVFRKYTNNAITYEVVGPITARQVGMRINKFGKEVPEKYEWVDPRTGEQLIRTDSGMLTPQGTRLKNRMGKAKIGNKSLWETFIDREFWFGDSAAGIDNPWA